MCSLAFMPLCCIQGDPHWHKKSKKKNKGKFCVYYIWVFLLTDSKICKNNNKKRGLKVGANWCHLFFFAQVLVLCWHQRRKTWLDGKAEPVSFGLSNLEQNPGCSDWQSAVEHQQREPEREHSVIPWPNWLTDLNLILTVLERPVIGCLCYSVIVKLPNEDCMTRWIQIRDKCWESLSLFFLTWIQSVLLVFSFYLISYSCHFFFFFFSFSGFLDFVEISFYFSFFFFYNGNQLLQPSSALV